MISAFEYSMRKLLYIFCALHHDEKTNERLSSLESKDFGEIFTTLFVDESFMLEVKKCINNKPHEYYTKQEVIESINSLQENTLWDQLLGATIVPTLRNKHGLVREYRNDVMHSHNITWEKYNKIKELFTQVNEELIETIQNVETKEKEEHDPLFVNMALDKIIQSPNYWENIMMPDSPYVRLQQQIAPLLEQQNQWKDFLKLTPEQMKILKSFTEAENIYKQTMQNLDGMNNALQQVKDNTGARQILDEINTHININDNNGKK